MNTISATFSPVSLTSALTSGAATISAGAGQLNRDAQQIANPDSQDSTNSLLDLNQSSQLAEVGAAVIRTSDQMLGTLLNTFA
jgi:hypothetical protein